jgi:hypothetical protein
MRSEHKISARKPEGKGSLMILRHQVENNIKLEMKQYVRLWTRFNLLRQASEAGSCGYNNESSLLVTQKVGHFQISPVTMSFSAFLHHGVRILW